MRDDRIRLRKKEKRFLVRRLASLTHSGMPLIACFELLAQDASAPVLSRMLASIADDLLAGRTCAYAFARFPRTFDRLDVGLVRIGESSGTLSHSFVALADELEKRDATRRKVEGALLYPAVIAVAIVLVTGFLLLYLFPRIVPVFVSLHVQLPLATRVVMAVSHALLRYGIVIALGGGLCIVGCVVVWRRSPAIRIQIARIFLQLPVLRDVIRSYHLSNSLRMLSLLLASGTSLMQSFMLLAELSSHPLYARTYREMTAIVERGGRVSDAFAGNPKLFPTIAAQMTAVGERTGTLAASFEYLADLYEEELDELTRTLTSLVEPALMLSMGLVIGFIAVSIIAPIYGITSHLHP